VTGKKYAVTTTTSDALLQKYQKLNVPEEEKGLLGLEVVVATMGATDLEDLKVINNKYKKIINNKKQI